MGKNITAQKRGRGTSVYRAPSFRYVGVVKHRPLSSKESSGKVTDIVHSTGHYAPVLKVSYDDRVDSLEIAPFGVKVGDEKIDLKDEHTEYKWGTYEEVSEKLEWDSNKTALWELNHRLLKNKLK